MLIFPWSFWDCQLVAPLALLIDLVLGDPALPWPHPVRGVGALIDRLEKPCRRFADYSNNPKIRAVRGRFAGLLALSFCSLLVGALVWALISFPVAGFFFALYFAWAGLAMGCLVETGRDAIARAETAPLIEARLAVSWLVSRETGNMDRETLRKTLADTLSENFTDALVAPFFWLVVAGPVGLWIYKTVSCFDSQWGYLTPRWKDLGWAGAKGDDLLAWLPARIGAFSLFLCDKISALFPRSRLWRGHWPGWKIVAKDARGMPSPNSGWSMAACAWLCDRRMAGSSVYFGKLVRKPWLGPVRADEWDRTRLLALCRLMEVASVAAAIFVCSICLGVMAIGCLIF